MAADENGRGGDGFEFKGEFFRWNVSAIGKDLMLIDKFSGLPVADFFEIVEDDFDRGRAPIMLTLIATSIRAGHPDWTVERIVRTVMDLSLDEVTFLTGDVEEPKGPPASEGEEPTGESSPSPSKSPASEVETATFKTSNATPA